VLIDDAKYPLERLAFSLRRKTPRERFGNGIERYHPPLKVGRNDCIADAGEGDFEPRALLLKFFGLAFQRFLSGQ
jgi:hypothetical protein